MTYIKRVVLQSTNDLGEYVNVPGDGNGHLEVAIHSPRLPFNSLHTEKLTTVGSFGGFIEGEKVLHGNRFSYFNSSTAVNSSTYVPLFTIQNSLFFGGKANQSVVNLLSIACAQKHTNPCIIYIVKNARLGGTPSFSSFANSSCTNWDTAATSATWDTNDQVIWSGHLGDTGNLLFEFTQGIQDLTLQPGEIISVVAKSLGAGSPNFVTTSLNTREDQ